MLRYWRMSVAIVLVAGLAALAISFLLPKQYQAHVTVELADPTRGPVFAGGGVLPEDLERYTARQIDVAGSSEVLQRVTKLSAETSVDDVKSHVKVTAENPGQIIITAEASTAQGAADLANTVTRAYGEFRLESSQQTTRSDVDAIEKSIAAFSADIDRLNVQLKENPNDSLLSSQVQAALSNRRDLQARIRELQINADAYGNGFTFVDEARPPSNPAEPQPLRNAAVASLLGLLLAAAIAAVRARRQATADEPAVPSAILEAPMLGPIPELASEEELAGVGKAGSPLTEAYQLVTASLKHVFPWTVLLVTSASQGDGKTVTATNVAAAAARSGIKVVLVDGDVRSARLTQRLIGAAEQETTGLTELARDEAGVHEASRTLQLAEGVLLPFVPAGTSDGDVGTLFRTAGMAAAVQRLRAAYELVIIDTPSMLAVADVASLAGQADGILLVVRRKTPISTLNTVRQRLTLMAAPLVGFVFTKAQDRAAPYPDRDVPPNADSNGSVGRHTRRRRPRPDAMAPFDEPASQGERVGDGPDGSEPLGQPSPPPRSQA